MVASYARSDEEAIMAKVASLHSEGEGSYDEWEQPYLNPQVGGVSSMENLMV